LTIYTIRGLQNDKRRAGGIGTKMDKPEGVDPIGTDGEFFTFGTEKGTEEPGTEKGTAGDTSPTSIGTRPGTRPGTRTGTRTEKEKVLPDLALLEIPVPAVKRTRNTSNKGLKELSENIAMLLKTGTDVIALRAGELWVLEDAEVESIAQPLAKVLEKIGWLDKAVNASPLIQLIAATGIVLCPRIIVQVALNKAKKEVKKDEGTIAKTPDKTTGNGTAPRSVFNPDKEFLESLSM
jgi:hypothetical protein